jgi:hypothetical protein
MEGGGFKAARLAGAGPLGASNPLEAQQITFNSKLVWSYHHISIIEGSLEVKLPTIWTNEKQSREEAERRERLEERRVEEKE